MYRAAVRRLVVLVAITVTVTALGSLGLGALAGASASRSLALGCYAVGSFLLIAAFFVGNRGPVRLRSESPGSGVALFPLFGARRLGWASKTEQQETIGHATVFIVLGLVLVLVGAAFDSQHVLW
jgi:hypothetical protein